MKVIICPGVHEGELSDRFIAALQFSATDCEYLLFPTEKYPAYSPFHLWQWLQLQSIEREELLFISFSAGVVAAMGAIIPLQLQKATIKGLVAIDGWGVPLWGNFPIYRCSHDYFTHWSSAILGTGQSSFYSDPAVEHLSMWGEPELCHGRVVHNSYPPQPSSLKEYIQDIVRESNSSNT